MKSIDWVIVGAGFTGAVLAERIASQLDKKVIVIDRRAHIGGNAHDEYDEHGILVHCYGAHIFHTNSKRIWDYVSQFTTWRPYFHEVKSLVEGKLIPVPFNLNSLAMAFPSKLGEKIGDALIARYGFGTKVPVLRLLEENDPDLKAAANYCYRQVFENYTLKQWDLKPEQLDASVTGRVPINITRDDRYFQDTYQAIPTHGYNRLFRRLLDHKNIRILTKTDYKEVADDFKSARIVFTGPIDEFFAYKHGRLPYRSLRFDFKNVPTERFQETAVVNYPNDHDFTRILEFKHFSSQSSRTTSIAYEYPEPHEVGINEPYYPIPMEQNRELYLQYADEAASLDGRVTFAGRLADYKYYNMDQAVGRALKVFDSIASQTADKKKIAAA